MNTSYLDRAMTFMLVIAVSVFAVVVTKLALDNCYPKKVQPTYSEKELRQHDSITMDLGMALYRSKVNVESNDMLKADSIYIAHQQKILNDIYKTTRK